MNATPSHLLRIREVAAEFGVHPKTVRRRLATGKLRYMRLPGGERRVPHGDGAAVLRRTLTDPGAGMDQVGGHR